MRRTNCGTPDGCTGNVEDLPLTVAPFAVSAPWIDAHCHLADLRWGTPKTALGAACGEDDDSPNFSMAAVDAAVDAVMKRAQQVGIGRLIQGGVSPVEWQRQKVLSERYPGRVFCAFGLHPWWVAEQSDAACNQAFELLKREWAFRERAVGLGELGLDQKRAGPAGLEHQLKWFEAQLELARERDLPLILHVVGAHELAVATLRRVGVPSRGGLVHSFSAGPEQARAYLALGLTLSVSAVVVGKGFERLKKAVVTLPSENFVIESDAPDQTPQSWPRDWNRPDSILETARALAVLRGLDPQSGAIALLEQSRQRLEKVFEL